MSEMHSTPAHLVYLAAEDPIPGHPWGGRHVTLCGHNCDLSLAEVIEKVQTCMRRALPAGYFQLERGFVRGDGVFFGSPVLEALAEELEASGLVRVKHRQWHVMMYHRADPVDMLRFYLHGDCRFHVYVVEKRGDDDINVTWYRVSLD
jgi:hypothetical protein